MNEGGIAAGPFFLAFAARRSLIPIIRFTVHAAIMDAGFARETADDMETVLDEALTNILDHTYKDNEKGEVELSLHFDKDRLTLVLADHGNEFNPLEQPEVDMVEYFRVNQVRGLGVHLIRKLVEEASYLPREGGGNIFMLTKTDNKKAQKKDPA